MAIKLLSDAELLALPPIEWLVQDFLALDSKASFWGLTGSHKSFLVFDLAASLAAGFSEWQGLALLPATERDYRHKPLVIYIAAEGGAGLAKRRKAWGQVHPEIRRMGPLNLHYVVQPVLIHDSSETLASLETQIDALIDYRQEGDPIVIDESEEGIWADPEDSENLLEYYPASHAQEWPVLIVIDTLAESFVGDENNTGAMNAFNYGLARLRLKYHATILVIHHCGRDPGHERGSTAFKGGLDSQFEVSMVEGLKGGRTQIALRNDKQRETSSGGEWFFEAVTVTLPKGETSKAVIPWVENPPTGAETLVLQAVRHNGPLSRKDLLKILEGQLSTSSVDKALVVILENGQIIKESMLFRGKL